MKPRKNPWQDEIDLAVAICSALGCQVEPSAAAYEIAKVSGDGVQLIIYPHTVKSTRNQHARVRDNGSKDKSRALRVMTALFQGDGLPEPAASRVRYSCTFSWKNMTAAQLMHADRR